MIVRRGTGYKRDALDSRDCNAVRSVPKLSAFDSAPASTTRLDPYTETLDQGRLNCCVDNAVAQAVRVEEIRQLMTRGHTLEEAKLQIPFLSRLFLYYFTRGLDHATASNSGTSLRQTFQIMNTLGFCSESVWPYSDDPDPQTGVFARMPDSSAVRLAFDQRLSAETLRANVIKYSRILDDGYARVDTVKRAIASPTSRPRSRRT
jgi:hypothetical protein